MSRWIKLYENVLNWRWAHKPEYVSFMVHCLLLANSQPKKWENIEIPRGSFVTTIKNMAERVGISERTFRTIIQHLIECEFLSVKTTNRYTLITICNYESYQERKEVNRQTDDNQTTNNRQTDDNQTTNNRQSIDNQTTHTLEYIDNKNKQDLKENKDLKDSFLKNGKAAEKKVFKIEEIKAALAAEGIYMTENGYVEFKALNEGENGYGYKGGIIRSAQNFLQKPMNQKYSLAKGNNGNGKGKGKNTPPTPPQPPQASTDKQVLAVWETFKNAFRDKMTVVEYKFIDKKPDLYPIKIENGLLHLYFGTKRDAEAFIKNNSQLINAVQREVGYKLYFCFDSMYSIN